MKKILPGANVISHATADCKKTAFVTALNKMPEAQVQEVMAAADVICTKVSRTDKRGITMFGEYAALEVLAALGAWLEEQEVRHTVIGG